MNDQTPGDVDVARRDLLKTIGLGAVASTLAGAARPGLATGTGANPAIAAPQAPAGGYNILFILTDQERQFRPGELPAGYELPGHARLAQRGTVFENHHINSCVCTPSRSVVYTGQHIQHTKMFDNTNFPWISSMSTEIPTVGDLLR